MKNEQNDKRPLNTMQAAICVVNGFYLSNREKYSFKVFTWYIFLIVLAVFGYIFLESWLKLTNVFDKSSQTTLVVGLIAWTVAMIVPIAAYYAITDWRKQQRELNYSEFAKSILMSYKTMHDRFDHLSVLIHDFINDDKFSHISKIKSVNQKDFEEMTNAIIEFHDCHFRQLERDVVFFDVLQPLESLRKATGDFFCPVLISFNTIKNAGFQQTIPYTPIEKWDEIYRRIEVLEEYLSEMSTALKNSKTEFLPLYIRYIDHDSKAFVYPNKI